MLTFNPVWWQRLRHLRGFGIHSPFAFRFITEVLNPSRRYRYYAEDVERKDIRRIIARLCGFFGDERVAYVGPSSEALRRPGEPSVPVADAGIIVVDLKDPLPPSVVGRVRSGSPCVLLCLHHGKGRIRPLLDSMPSGMSFRNRSTRAVLVVDSALPRQDFWVRW